MMAASKFALRVSLIAFAAAIALAQDTVAPTTGENTISPRGENDGKYRSDVNFGDGVRLLSSYLTVNSRDGRGRWFDEITLTTQGLGNDPYESATFRIQKNRWYRYDLLWRSNDYFNPGLTVANGEHLEDTTYRLQDHDL